jgi:excisionase family DNA binding protein
MHSKSSDQIQAQEMNEILTVDEVAALLMCTKETVELCARQGKLPGVKFSRSWVFPREALLQRVNEMALAGMPSQSTPTAGATGRRRQVPPVLPVPPPGPDREALLKVIREGLRLGDRSAAEQIDA